VLAETLNLHKLTRPISAERTPVARRIESDSHTGNAGASPAISAKREPVSLAALDLSVLSVHHDFMNFRDASLADASCIAAFHAASWRRAYRGMLSDQYLDGDLESDRTRVWVERLTTPKAKQRVVLAQISDQLAGFACAFGSEDPDLGALLDNLHVRHDFQHQGIGSQLMMQIAYRCQNEFAGEGLHLWVLEPNLQARRFYEHLGATKAGQEVWHSPDGGAIPSLCYAWSDVTALISTLKLRTS
jgi:ribosomal protein S18 acetylase RimI-like enzyme